MSTLPGTWRLGLPPLAVADVIRSADPQRTWQEAVTVVPGPVEYGPAAIVDGVVPVTLPDDYVGAFEVHLHAEDGAVLVVAEGRRLPPLA